MKPVPNPEAEAEFQAAETLFQQGKLAEAETAFAKIAKKRKGTPWGEKAQFYLAETQFQRGKLVAAHDSYEKLIADYPGTEYLDKLVAREYEIGQIWLAQDDPKAKPEQKLPWNARFDGRRRCSTPTATPSRPSNTSGTTTRTARSPTTPRCRIADYHMDVGDYETAAIYYDQLITDHPKSPYLQRAQLSAIDARMKGYIGPEYDGAGLEKARELIKQTMAHLPRPPGRQREALPHARPDQRPGGRADLRASASTTSGPGRSPRPSTTSARSASAGPRAPGPSRPRPSSPRSPRCPAPSRCPARS